MQLRAAQATRIEENPFQATIEFSGKDIERLQKMAQLPKEKLSDTEEEIATARGLWAHQEQWGQDRPKIIRLVAFFLRLHGELPELESLLASFKADSADTKWEGLKAEATQSITLEKQYLAKAESSFQKLLADGQKTYREGKRGNILYLLGELQRRQGKKQEALANYQAALASGDLEKGLQDWCKEQMSLVGP
jgi:hypothetical protein